MALQRALHRAAHLGLGLPIDVLGAQSVQVGRTGVLSGVQPGDLIVALEQDSGQSGVMALSLDLLSALIEVQTLGAVSKSAAQPRALTSTDAAVAMPLIDGTLTGFETLLPRCDGDAMPGFHFREWVPNETVLAAQLADAAYDLFDVQIGIGAGERLGRLVLALPVRPDPPLAQTEDTPENGSCDTLKAEVLEAQVRLDTVLHRVEMPLHQVGALKPGDVLTLPARALSEVTLHAGPRRMVAKGMLGQISGKRAVCVSSRPEQRPTPSSPEQQAATMAEVDLADPGLVATRIENGKPGSSGVGSQNTPSTRKSGADTDADEILRELGLNQPTDVLEDGDLRQTVSAPPEDRQGAIAPLPFDDLQKQAEEG